MKRRERPSWDEYFMNITIDTARRSSCLKRNVGAVIVRDNVILTTGYNGAPRGVESCYHRGECFRRSLALAHGKEKDLCLASHGEANAIYQAARIGTRIEGAKLYVTTYPCIGCAKAVIQAGLTEVIYLFEYYGKSYEESKKLLKKAKIKTRKLRYNFNNEDFLKLR